MKLSQISTDKGLDVLCELTPYVASISADEALMKELRRKVQLPADATRAEFLAVGIDKMNSIMPIIFKEHKDDVCGVLAVLNEKSIEDIKKQTFIKTGMQIREVLKDKELLDFFRSFAE